jgi:hypothetical protein
MIKASMLGAFVFVLDIKCANLTADTNWYYVCSQPIKI